MQSVSTRFGNLTKERAASILATAPLTGETHGDRLAALRILQPVTTPEEVKAVKRFKNGRTYSCVGCKKFAFPEPRTRCYWCQNKTKVRTSQPVNSSSLPPSPQSSVLRLGVRPTLEQVREYLAATKKQKKRGNRGAR